jgi:hypothetical protein
VLNVQVWPLVEVPLNGSVVGGDNHSSRRVEQVLTQIIDKVD